MKPLLFLSLLGLFTWQSGFCQYAETISSDRPGASFSANTVGSRVFQTQIGGDFVSELLENRYVNSYYSGGFVDALFRVGLTERFEIGFPVAFRSVQKLRVNSDQNLTVNSLNFGINLRSNILKSNGKTPNIGMLAEVRFPELQSERFAEGISQTLLVMIEQPLERRIRLASNIGMVRFDIAQMVYTLNLSVDISPSATIFAEHFGSYSSGRRGLYQDGDRFHNWYGRVNGGFSITPMNYLQIDVQAGWGSVYNSEFTTTDTDWNVGLGFSYRVRFKKRDKATSNTQIPE